MLTDLNVAVAWLQARVQLARSDESGASAVEWLLIIIATIGIAGIAIAAVRHFVQQKSNDLN